MLARTSSHALSGKCSHAPAASLFKAPPRSGTRALGQSAHTHPARGLPGGLALKQPSQVDLQRVSGLKQPSHAPCARAARRRGGEAHRHASLFKAPLPALRSVARGLRQSAHTHSARVAAAGTAARFRAALLRLVAPCCALLRLVAPCCATVLPNFCDKRRPITAPYCGLLLLIAPGANIPASGGAGVATTAAAGSVRPIALLIASGRLRNKPQ